MAYCPGEGIFDQLSDLVLCISDNTKEEPGVDSKGAPILIRSWKRQSRDDHAKLRALLHQWRYLQCPSGGCVAGKCRFAYPFDWVECHGYRNLNELLSKLKSERGQYILRNKAGSDALNAPRRPGHFNP
jgi:hypothetical protein